MQLRKNKEIKEYSSGETITMSEILKDHPKELKETEELSKWIKENPDLFTFPEEKKTQGQKKMKQLLEDTRRNSKFLKDLKKINESMPAYEHVDVKPLYMLYRFFLHELISFRKSNLSKNRTHKLKVRLCENYGIDPLLLDHLLFDERNDQLENLDFSEETTSDICIVESSEQNEKPLDLHSFHLKEIDGIEKKIYPVNIKIHKFATKRDTLDFIEKNWTKEVGPYLYKKRIKQRKLPREAIDFIWENRDKKAKEIILLLESKYPNIKLFYFDISKIISEEKKRRKIE